jgi:hypothetical protein
MPFARKVLWIVDFDSNPNLFYGYLKSSGCNTACIRTRSSLLKPSIATFHQIGIKVWGWRWPCVQPTNAPHAYAPEEAAFVAQELIPSGLDGYVVDPESDDDGAANDWNQKSVPDPHHPGQHILLSQMAADFCRTIKTAAQGKPFHLGVTSGCGFPGPGQKTMLPWKEFIAAADSLYPQCYWRWRNAKNDLKEINGGSPDAAIKRALPAWTPVSQGKPIIPMAGEVNLVTADEVHQYGRALTAMNVSEADFYVGQPPVAPDVLATIKAL